MTPMTLTEQLLTVLALILGTMLTRFLPFMIFSGKKTTPKYVRYLGAVLPGAVFSMLVVYCLRTVSLFSGSHGLPELLALSATIGLHLWKRNTLLSVAVGTLLYMLLIQLVFPA